MDSSEPARRVAALQAELLRRLWQEQAAAAVVLRAQAALRGSELTLQQAQAACRSHAEDLQATWQARPDPQRQLRGLQYLHRLEAARTNAERALQAQQVVAVEAQDLCRHARERKEGLQRVLEEAQHALARAGAARTLRSADEGWLLHAQASVLGDLQ